MSAESQTGHLGWEDGHGHLTEGRAHLSPVEVQSAMALSRALSRQSITAILKDLDEQYDVAIESGVDDADLHIIGQEIDVYHMAQLHAVEDEWPPAA